MRTAELGQFGAMSNPFNVTPPCPYENINARQGFLCNISPSNLKLLHLHVFYVPNICSVLPKLEMKARKTEILVPPLNLWSYPKLKYNPIRGLTGTDRKSNCDSIRLRLKHSDRTVDCLEYTANIDITRQCQQRYVQSPMDCPKNQSAGSFDNSNTSQTH